MMPLRLKLPPIGRKRRALLQQDREALLRLLQASGLTTDSIQVPSRPVEPAPSGSAHGWRSSLSSRRAQG